MQQELTTVCWTLNKIVNDQPYTENRTTKVEMERYDILILADSRMTLMGTYLDFIRQNGNLPFDIEIKSDKRWQIGGYKETRHESIE